jgi:hypothetical protein
MATWQDVKNLVSGIFAQNGILNDDGVWFENELDKTRPSQRGIVMRKPDTGAGEWVDVLSPIKNLSDSQLDVAFHYLGTQACGGLLKVEDVGYFARVSIPLTLSLTEFGIPIVLITKIASNIEEILSGGAAN